ncbi:hypothetical protein FXO38_13544 [Capsicum annuum]|nr:hypothetical protein FXO38_13544 [Capsicum annuum]
MLINWTQLLEESIEFIGDMDPTLLRGDLFMGFKNEATTELGLLKEWFSFVCWETFNPESAHRRLISGNANHLWTGANTGRGYVISKRNMLLGIVEMIGFKIGTNTQSKAAIDGEEGMVAYGLGGGMHGTKLMTCTKDYWGNKQGTHKNNPCCTDLSWSMVEQRSNQTPKVVEDNQQGSKGRIYEVLHRIVCKDRDWIEQLCDRKMTTDSQVHDAATSVAATSVAMKSHTNAMAPA